MHRDYNNPYTPKNAHNFYANIIHPKLVGEFMLMDDVRFYKNYQGHFAKWFIPTDNYKYMYLCR